MSNSGAGASTVSLGDLVAANPAAAAVFDRYGLDYCCHGSVSLASACASAGIDAAAVVAELDALAEPTDAGWTALGPVELAAHIVESHHAYLHEELPLLDALAQKVNAVHGARHPELGRVVELVRALRAELEPHLAKEEQVLFPAIRALAAGPAEFPFGPVANPIRMMEVEHDRCGELLVALRQVTDAYAVPADACASYRSLYARLAELESDTHRHIHKENHVLFPAARALADG